MRRLLRPVSLAIIGVSCVALYALVGFVLIPYVIERYVFPAVAEQLKRPVSVKEVEFNPFTLALRLVGVEVQEQDGSPVLGFEEFFIDFEAVSIVRQAYVFDTIRFGIPYVSAKVAKDGHMNLVDLVPPKESTPSPPVEEGKKEIPAVQIGHLEIAQGVVEFRDDSKSRPFAIDIVPINIQLNNFHTKPGGDNAYSFTAELGQGETLDWKGTVTLEPIRSEGTLVLSGVQVPTLFRYVQDRFNFDVTSGTLDVRGAYRFDTGANAVELEVSDSSVHLNGFSLGEKDDPEAVITIPTLNVDGIRVSLNNRSLSVESVIMNNAANRMWRNPDGTVNLQTLFASTEPQLPSDRSEKSSKPSASDEQLWTVAVKEVQVSHHAIRFEDRTLPLPARIEVTDLSVKTRDLAYPFKGSIPLTVEHRINETGRLAVDGQVAPDPLSLDVAVTLKGLALAPFQPYTESFSRLAIEDGAVDLDGKIHVGPVQGKEPRMTFQGNVGVKSLALTHRDSGEPVASWKQLQLKQIDLAVDPTTVVVDEVGLEQPTVYVTIGSDGTTNLAAVGPPATQSQADSEQHPGPKTDKKAAPAIAIKTVKLLKGVVSFKDESIIPPVRTALNDLTGTVKGLSSKQLAKADVEISGRVDRAAPLKVAGQINPLSEHAFTNLTVKFDSVDLIAASSYSGKYAGYPIRKGKLFLDLAYKVSQRQLEAENKVAIDQLTFGDKTDSPDAVSLPVPLAVALLKDRKGRIDIDLPIRGDLNDPDFKYGKVVWSTLLNLLTKLVASPFTLMGKLIPGGGDGEDLQYAAFEPGESVLSPGERKKLDALAKGLEDRPGLKLEVGGAADPVRDRQALGYQRLQSMILVKWRQEKRVPSEAAVPPDEEARLVRELFEQQPPAITSASSGAATPGGPPKPLTLEEMKQRLVVSMPIDETALRDLAQRRADAVREQLVGVGHVAEERLFLTEPMLAATGHDLVRTALSISAGT